MKIAVWSEWHRAKGYLDHLIPLYGDGPFQVIGYFKGFTRVSTKFGIRRFPTHYLRYQTAPKLLSYEEML